MCHMLFFFFSSRRRHTRWPRDWSSDVCSSDLALQSGMRVTELADLELAYAPPFNSAKDPVNMLGYIEIGRASCRERGWSSVVARAVERRWEEGRRARLG